MSGWAADLRAAGWDLAGSAVPGASGTFAPAWVMVHHYAGSEAAASSQSEAHAARHSFDHSPICHLYLDTSGTAHLITEGRANHAGLGQYPGIPTDGGNGVAIGIEVQCNGTHPLSTHPTGYAALIRLCADLCRSLGVGAARVIGHREYAPTRKIDPRDNLATIRRDVAARLEQDDDMTPEQARTLDLIATRTDYLANRIGLGNVNGRTDYLANTHAPDVLARLARIEAALGLEAAPPAEYDAPRTPAPPG